MTPAAFSSRFNIILASASPRRKMLLEHLGLKFEVRVIPTDESYSPDLKGAEIPLFLARKKAAPFLPRLQTRDLLITADTIVWLNGKVLNKPKNREDALGMLSALQGKTHEVFSGVGLNTLHAARYFAVQSEVRFRSLSPAEIGNYVDKCAPYDKAGAYGAQEFLKKGVNACSMEEKLFTREIGAKALENDCFPLGNDKIPFYGVDSVSGSYFNVMGFPLRESWEEMKKMILT